VSISQYEKSGDLDRLLQRDRRRRIEVELGTEAWVDLYRQDSSDSESVGWYSALIPSDRKDAALRDPSWDFSIGDGRPGFVEYFREGERIVEYLPRGSDDNVEPLVIYRNFFGIKPSLLEIAEEFRLYLNLYFSPATNDYLIIDEDGESEAVIEVRPTRVRARLREVRQFLAAKQCFLALYFDSKVYSTLTVGEVPPDQLKATHVAQELRYEFHVAAADWMEGFSSFSRLLGKKLIRPPERREARIWPFAEDEEKQEEFIIGTDANGGDVVHTCDPESLSDFFGKNPGSPNYLTPVFFRRDVLGRYLANPDRFQIEDGFLRCRGLWGLRIDNNHPSNIVVFLGDLGRDLSLREQNYWRSFNVRPRGGISEVEYRRSILGEFADASRPDLRLRALLPSFCESWKRRFGWELFLPLHEGDSYCLTCLSIPVTDSQKEFDEQVMKLSKLLVDSLNEAALVEAVGPGPENEKGIAKFERYLEAAGYPEAGDVAQFFRDLQALRSTSAGHRKGENYERLAKRLQLFERRLSEVFSDLLVKAEGVITDLERFFLKSKKGTDVENRSKEDSV
jgi:hypothetical protein